MIHRGSTFVGNTSHVVLLGVRLARNGCNQKRARVAEVWQWLVIQDVDE